MENAGTGKTEVNVVRDARQKLGLSQRELAVHLGVHHGTLAAWERGDPRYKLPVYMPRVLDMLLAQYGMPPAVPSNE